MKILTIFILIIVIIALVMVGTAMTHRSGRDIDRQYIDEDGDHIYYDRSLIRKKDYARRHPDEAGALRTLRNLFRGK